MLAQRARREGAGAVETLALIEENARGVLAETRALVAAGASVDQASEFGWSPLIVSASNGHAEVVAELLLLGADPSSPTTKSSNAIPAGSTALSIAQKRGHANVVALLAGE